MIRINNEYYLSHKVSNLLKKAGFDWELKTCYIGKSVRPYKYHKFFNWNKPRKDFEKDGSDNLFHAFITQKKTNSFISAPTLEVAQRWFREVKGILLYITPKRVNMEWKWDFWYIDLRDKTNIEQRYSTKNFNTYEEAQEEGIKKTLKMILENVE